MPKAIDDSDAWENIETLSVMINIIATIIYDSDYMRDEPNENTRYQRALAVQTMSAINLLLLIVDEKEDTSLLAFTRRALSLRSLIEVVANINYFSLKVDDDSLAEKFLQTSQVSRDVLTNLRNQQPITKYYWTKTTIAHRIRLLEKNPIKNYSDMYYYLSSFVHSDAGLLAALPEIDTHKFVSLFFAYTYFNMIDMMDALVEAGVVSEQSSEKFLFELKRYFDSKKKNSATNSNS